jgi:hypothetical protein
MLQDAIGSLRALRFLTQRLSNLPVKVPAERHDQEAAPENVTAREALRGPGWDLSKLPVFAPDRANRPQARSSLSPPPLPSIIQPKLVVGEANDPLEHEANRIADQVMRMPDHDVSMTGAPPQISRKCAACEEEEQHHLQTKRQKSASFDPRGLDLVDDVLASSGEPLGDVSRTFFEPRFQRDFSDVRVHTDPTAGASARAIGALAYTVGRDIVFAPGRYSPASAAGRDLLAHELAHVVQQGQSQAVPTVVQRQTAPGVHEILGETQAQRDQVPYDKWSEQIEHQYRVRGDMVRANAVRNCRTKGLDGCAWILTLNEVQALYALGQSSGGDKTKIKAGMATAAPMLGLQLARMPPTMPPPGLVPPTMPPVTAPPVVTAPPPGVIPPAAAAPLGVVAAEAAVVAAVVVINLLALYTLYEMARFQAKLKEQGFIILEDPLALCVGGCHMPQQKAGPGLLDFPPLPDNTKDFFKSGPASPGPGSPSDADRKAIEDWINPPTAAGPSSPQQGPAPAPGPSPQQGPTPAPGPRRRPNQTCDDATLDALQAAMHRVCDSIPGESCSPSKVSPKRLDRRPCSQIRLRIQALRDCLAERQRVQDLCFGGKPDQIHLDQMAQLNNGLNACLALEAVNCAPGHPMAGL